jgi:hypothetical protein
MQHVPLSAHTAPSIHASLCCALAPALNVEYFHDHARIENMIFEGAVNPVGGNLSPHLNNSGLGLQLKPKDAEPFCLLHQEFGNG